MLERIEQYLLRRKIKQGKTTYGTIFSALEKGWQRVEENSYAEIPGHIDPLLKDLKPASLSTLSGLIWERQRKWSAENPEQSHKNPYTGLAMYVSTRLSIICGNQVP